MNPTLPITAPLVAFITARPANSRRTCFITPSCRNSAPSMASPYFDSFIITKIAFITAVASINSIVIIIKNPAFIRDFIDYTVNLS